MNRVALHSVGSRAELSLRLCFAALSHRTQHKHGGTNPSLKNTRPPLHLENALASDICHVTAKYASQSDTQSSTLLTVPAT